MVLWQKFAVLETDRSQSYANLVLCFFYIFYLLTIRFTPFAGTFQEISTNDFPRYFSESVSARVSGLGWDHP
jgi:hypothetical protein